ncbi:MAG: NUDIX domain-containing protein [Nitrososphaera sp.]|nr:NUDIX domain-containing protein [Nitrososphaera sp.]
MIEYVLGFYFSEDLKNLVLIGKRRPPWQAGKFNGVGGKIEDGESPYVAMVREFREETGVHTPPSDWSLRATMTGSDWKVYVFAGRAFDSTIRLVPQPEEEEVPVIFPVDKIPENVIPNLRWLIPLCLDFEAAIAHVTYR